MSRVPHVTDHALVRYLERVVGVDLDVHRQAIEARVAGAVALGASAIVSEGYRYALTDSVVITVTRASSDPRRPVLKDTRCPDCRRREGEVHSPTCPQDGVV